MSEELNPRICEECARSELVNEPLSVVAKHWLLKHPSYLELLRTAVTIYQAQEYGLERRG